MAERSRFILEQLQQQYPNPGIPLDHSDAFTLLVAVALSAQCTDKRVNLTTPALFAVAPDAATMAQMEAEDILPLIKSCGLAQGKAQRLVLMARQLMERHEGVVPDNFADLEGLAGVGHKTASVVMSQAFGHAAFPVDTHIFRLARRWGLSKGKDVVAVERDLKRRFAKKHWNHLHIAMVLWGREYCPARGCQPRCAICSAVAR